MAGGISPTPILTPIILHASPLFCTCHVVSVCKPCIRYMCRRVGWPKRRSFPLSSVPAVRASSPRSNSGQRLFSREQVLPVSSLSSCRMNFDMKNHEIPVLTPVLMAATGEGYLQLCICVLSVSRHVRAATQRTLSNGLTSKSMTRLDILKYHAYKGRPSSHRVSTRRVRHNDAFDTHRSISMGAKSLGRLLRTTQHVSCSLEQDWSSWWCRRGRIQKSLRVIILQILPSMIFNSEALPYLD